MWHASLTVDVSMNWPEMSRQFISRFHRGLDQPGLNQRFHNLKLVNNNVDTFLNDLQIIGGRLGKNSDELLSQFMIGLPTGLYRWVFEKNPTSLEAAARETRAAIEIFFPGGLYFDSNYARSNPSRQEVDDRYLHADEPMENWKLFRFKDRKSHQQYRPK